MIDGLQSVNSERGRQSNDRYADSFQVSIAEEKHHTYKGRDAKNAILNRLTSWPEAYILASETSDFYGDYLQYHEDSNLEASYYAIDLQHDPAALQSARIRLQLGTHRASEALFHELLHLNTRMHGYPIGEKSFIPIHLIPYAGIFTGIYPKIGNLIEHELIFDSFLRYGFDKRNFLGCLSPPPNYCKMSSIFLNLGVAKEVGYSWWCLEYFRHWISARHWVGDEPIMYADYALFWGSKVYPNLQSTAQKIRDHIESGALLDKQCHHKHVNKLLELMKIPLLTEWVTIQMADGKPIAVPLNGKSRVI